MKNKRKNILQHLLIISIVVSLFVEAWGTSVFAENAENTKDVTTDMEQTSVSGADISNKSLKDNNLDTESEMELESEDSFGELLVKSLESENEYEDTGYDILAISVENSVATVKYYALDEVCIVVGIYSEDGNELLATGSEVVASETENIDIPIAIENMPKYFFVKAYMVEKDTLRPLCKEYSTPNYTKEMQDFFSKTIDDFQEDRVYNLDSDSTNNFAIYKDEIIVKEQMAGINTIIYEDYEEKKYIIENADDDVRNLKEGDVYVYEENEGLLIVKVSSIEIENTTVTLYGTESNIEDVFDYIKIDTSAGTSEASLDTTDADPCVSLNEVEKNSISENTLFNSISGNSISENSFFGEVTRNRAFEGEIGDGDKFEFDLYEADMVSGKIGIEVGVSLKYYLSLSYKSIDLCFNVDASIKAEISTDLDNYKKKLGKVKLPTVSGVNIALVVYFKIDAEISLTIEGGIETEFGISYNSDTGIKDIKKIDTDLKVQIEGKFNIGLEFDPQVELLDDKICYIGGKIDAGLEINGKKNLFADETDKNELHRCTWCFDGKINAVFSFGLKGKIFNTEKLGFELNLAKLSFKIKDWYFSHDLGQFGFGICPNRSMRVTVTVKDVKGRIVNDAEVNAWKTEDKSQELKTSFPQIAKGKTSAFLEKGSYYIEISSIGYKNKKQKIKVDEKPKNTVIYFDEINDVSFEPEIYDNSQNDYTLNDIQEEDLNQKFKGNIKQIEMADGGYRIAVVTKNDELFIADRDIFKDNGEVGSNLLHKVMDNVNKVIVEDYAHGSGAVYAAILTDGSLYTWSTVFDYDLEEDIISPPKKMLDNVQEVAIGDDHYIALTKNGDVYTWGDNSIGTIRSG